MVKGNIIHRSQMSYYNNIVAIHFGAHTWMDIRHICLTRIGRYSLIKFDIAIFIIQVPSPK